MAERAAPVAVAFVVEGAAGWPKLKPPFEVDDEAGAGADELPNEKGDAAAGAAPVVGSLLAPADVPKPNAGAAGLSACAGAAPNEKGEAVAGLSSVFAGAVVDVEPKPKDGAGAGCTAAEVEVAPKEKLGFGAASSFFSVAAAGVLDPNEKPPAGAAGAGVASAVEEVDAEPKENGVFDASFVADGADVVEAELEDAPKPLKSDAAAGAADSSFFSAEVSFAAGAPKLKVGLGGSLGVGAAGTALVLNAGLSVLFSVAAGADGAEPKLNDGFAAVSIFCGAGSVAVAEAGAEPKLKAGLEAVDAAAAGLACVSFAVEPRAAPKKLGTPADLAEEAVEAG